MLVVKVPARDYVQALVGAAALVVLVRRKIALVVILAQKEIVILELLKVAVEPLRVQLMM